MQLTKKIGHLYLLSEYFTTSHFYNILPKISHFRLKSELRRLEYKVLIMYRTYIYVHCCMLCYVLSIMRYALWKSVCSPLKSQHCCTPYPTGNGSLLIGVGSVCNGNSVFRAIFGCYLLC